MTGIIPRRFRPAATALALIAALLPYVVCAAMVSQTRSRAAVAVAAITREAAAERDVSDALCASYAAALTSSTATVADLRAEVAAVQEDNAALAREVARLSKPRVTAVSVNRKPRVTGSKPQVKRESLWTVTAYCSCRRCCGKSNGITASGRKAGPGTVAAQLPFGTRLRIGKLGTFTVRDRGGSIKGRRLDVWMPSHAAAVRFGRRQMRVVRL